MPKRITTINGLSLRRLCTRAKELALSGVRKGASRGMSLFLIVLKDPLQFRLIYLHTFWCELCNLYWRMGILSSAKLHRYGILLHYASEQQPSLRERGREWRRVHNLGIRKILSIHPRATLIDLYLVTTVCRHLFEEVYRKEGGPYDDTRAIPAAPPVARADWRGYIEETGPRTKSDQ